MSSRYVSLLESMDTSANYWPLGSDRGILGAAGNTVDLTGDASYDGPGAIHDGRFSLKLNDTLTTGFSNVLDYGGVQDAFSGGGTLAVWFYATGWGGGNFGRLADKYGSGDNLGWRLTLDLTNTRLKFQARFDDPGDASWGIDFATTQLNAWHMAAVSYDSDAAANDPTMYLDGSLVALEENTNMTGSYVSDSGEDMYVGGRASANDRGFAGNLAHLSLGATLTAAQIQQLYHAGIGPDWRGRHSPRARLRTRSLGTGFLT